MLLLNSTITVTVTVKNRGPRVMPDKLIHLCRWVTQSSTIVVGVGSQRIVLGKRTRDSGATESSKYPGSSSLPLVPRISTRGLNENWRTLRAAYLLYPTYVSNLTGTIIDAS